MSSRTPDTDVELEDELDDLVAEVLLARESGDCDAEQRVAAENPGHAAALARRLARLEGARGVLGAFGSGVRAVGLPERIGGHTILRELGRGGMGVVYLARDEVLGRTVALKAMTNPALAGEHGRERFQREVRAIAALSHPCIVPIHEAGEDGGTPYYTMPFIEGRSLAERLGELRARGIEPERLTGAHLVSSSGEGARTEGGEPGRSPSGDSSGSGTRLPLARSHVERVARLTLDVAEALVHAHARGLVHRDVKPSNILVSAEGRALLCDFGLARGEAAPGITRSGDLVGTPHYVAPEQAAGGEVDARSDVYALGTTLYELLTLKLPHEGRTTAEILHRIQTREPVPLRRWNPAVPRDLETICATAMAKEPARRYASAEELAADLRRFLTHRPVLARPVGPVTRAMRWTRRNPMTALALGSLTLLVVVGPTVFALFSRAAAARLEREQEATLAQRDRADRNVERVLRTIDEMLTRVSEEDLAHLPRMESVRRALLERALALHRELLEEGGGDDLRVRRKTAKSQRQVADIQLALGRLDEAGEAAARAVELGTAILEVPEADDDDREELAHALEVLSRVLEDRGDTDRAEAPLLRALELREGRRDSPEARRELAGMHFTLGRYYLSCSRLPDAERELRATIEQYERAMKEDPTDVVLFSLHAKALVNLASALSNGRRDEEAEPVLREALEAWRALVGFEPTWLVARLGLVKAMTNLADLVTDRNAGDEALELSAEAVRLGEEILAEHPDVPDYSEVLAMVYRIRMNAFRLAGELEVAAESGERGLVLLEEAERRFPDLAAWQRVRASTCEDLAIVYEAEGLTERALDTRRRGVEANRASVEGSSSNAGQRSRLGGVLNNLARDTFEAGKPEEALRLLEEAIGHQRAAIAAEPEVRGYREFLRNHLWGTAEISLSIGVLDRGASAAREMPRVGLPPGPEARTAAGLLARAVAVGGDAALVDEAIALLGEALAVGATDREDLTTAEELESLRGSPGFAALVERAGD